MLSRVVKEKYWLRRTLTTQSHLNCTGNYGELILVIINTPNTIYVKPYTFTWKFNEETLIWAEIFQCRTSTNGYSQFNDNFTHFIT